MVMTVRSREGGASQFALPTFPGMLLVRAGGGGIESLLWKTSISVHPEQLKM